MWMTVLKYNFSKFLSQKSTLKKTKIIDFHSYDKRKAMLPETRNSRIVVLCLVITTHDNAASGTGTKLGTLYLV